MEMTTYADHRLVVHSYTKDGCLHTVIQKIGADLKLVPLDEKVTHCDVESLTVEEMICRINDHLDEYMKRIGGAKC